MPDGSGLTLPVRGKAGQEIPMLIAAVSVGGDTLLTNPDIRVGAGDSAAVVNLFTFPHGYHIFNVGWRVATAFTAATTITLGDTDAAAAWAAAADVGATTADTAIVWSLGQVLNQTEGVGSTTAIADTTTHPVYGVAGRTMVADTSGDAIALNATFGGTMADILAGLIEVYAIYAPGLIFRRSST